ncbi:MAG: rhodanese-related sulfurtransferase [Pseudomonadales bacterium]|nr:rhodanese-related sulfurtransferase [Pseudomonadales bacterium]
MKQSTQDNSKTVVCALYHFTTLADFKALKSPLEAVMQRNQLRGTLLLASEGINGTIAGPANGIDALINWLKSDQRFNSLKWKISYDDATPFCRAKVKLKKEIVTMGVENIDPLVSSGTYVKPADWNQLILDPDVMVIDTRNAYEIKIGSFQGAINPETTTFREFPAYAEKSLHPSKNKKIAMFCTGGIRCEKSTAFLKQQGFTDVYHLQGGILQYLEDIPQADSLWQGECFVFDDRVSVNHQLESGKYQQCHACRMPLDETDRQHTHYQLGVSCHHCWASQTDKQTARFKERHKQVQLAKQRGESHIGADAVQHQQTRRTLKQAQKRKQ